MYIYICTEYKIQYTVYICDIQPAPQIPRTSRIAAGALLNFPVCWWCMPAPDRLRRLTVCLGHEDFWMTLSLPGPWSLWLHHGRRKMWNIASAKNGWQIRSTWSTSVLVRAKPQHLWILLGSHQGPGAATLSRGRCGAAIGPSQRRLVGRSPGGPLPGSLGPAKRLGPGGPPPLAPGQGLAVAGAGAVQWEVGNVAAAAGAEGLDFGATNWEPWRPWRLSWTRDTTGWWFGTFFIFPYIGNNHPNWLIFQRGSNHQPVLSRSMHDPAVPGRPRGRPSWRCWRRLDDGSYGCFNHEEQEETNNNVEPAASTRNNPRASGG